jgi:hypothetical protein
MRVEPVGKGGGSAAGGADAFDAGAVLREIARPRLTGSEGAAEVAAALHRRFQELGYRVDEQSFDFNPLPGRYGITAIGALYLAATVGAAVLLHLNSPAAAVSVLLLLLALTAIMALLAVMAIDALPYGRQQGSNLFARRPDRRPRYIVMAHRDSKSQLVPLAFRGPAIVTAVLAWVALLFAALVGMDRQVSATLLLLLGSIAAAAGVSLILCLVDNRSPGALDNASGVAAALGIAEAERAAADVAFLITDAEELGLAGARAAAPHLPPVFGVINLDGLDDHGTFYVFERFGLVRKQGLAPHLAAALLQEADARGEAIERRDLPAGIPVDHVPIVRAGTPALTLMRGSMQSLRRVHRPADSLDRLEGDGVTRTVALVTGALVRLREQARALEQGPLAARPQGGAARPPGID